MACGRENVSRLSEGVRVPETLPVAGLAGAQEETIGSRSRSQRSEFWDGLS